MLAMSALFVAAGGYVHLREWLDLYRHVPADSPGAAVVTVGFPVNAGVSLLFAGALALCAWRPQRLAPLVVGGAALFQLASLALLIATRTGSVLGWTEPSWTPGADQTRAVEIGALISLAAVAAVAVVHRRREKASLPSSDAAMRPAYRT